MKPEDGGLASYLLSKTKGIIHPEVKTSYPYIDKAVLM